MAKVLRASIRAELVLHAALLAWDRQPLLPLALGLAAHASYLPLLRHFPYIAVTGVDTLLSLGEATPREQCALAAAADGIPCVGLTLASAAAWGRHFWQSQHSVEQCLAVFVVLVLVVPFILLLSLAANESVLPGVPGSAPPKGEAPCPAALLRGVSRDAHKPAAQEPKQVEAWLWASSRP